MPRYNAFFPRFFSPPLVLLAVSLFAGGFSVQSIHADDKNAAQLSENPIGFREVATLLAEIPADFVVVPESVQAWSGSGIVAYVVQSPEGFKACMNNECGPIVDRVARGMPVVSPNEKYLAAVVQSGGDARVMLGQGLSKPFDMVYGLRFSPDSMKLAYIAQKNDAFNVYVNQEQHQSFAVIDPNQGLIFSRDSKRLAYVASKDRKKWHLVHNGEIGPAYDEIKHVMFSPDGRHLVYAAKQGGKWYLVVDGDQGRNGYVDIKRIRFSRGAEGLVYIARGDDGAFVVNDGEKSAVFEFILGEPVLSPNGKRLAYLVVERARRGKIESRIVVDGKAGPAFDQIGAYVFSPDSSQLAYMAKIDEKGMMVQNEEIHEAYESIGMPVFSLKGDLAYFVLDENQWRINKNGKLGPGFDSVENPVFSLLGDRMAYLARQGLEYMIIEDGEAVAGDVYEFAAYPTFSPDGRHLAYMASQEGEAFLVVDGEKGRERFLSFFKGVPLVFIRNDSVQGIASRIYADGRQEFWLIRAEIHAGNRE